MHNIASWGKFKSFFLNDNKCLRKACCWCIFGKRKKSASPSRLSVAIKGFRKTYKDKKNQNIFFSSCKIFYKKINEYGNVEIFFIRFCQRKQIWAIIKYALIMLSFMWYNLLIANYYHNIISAFPYGFLLLRDFFYFISYFFKS